MEKARINGDKNIVIQNNDGSEIILNIHDSEDIKRLFLDLRDIVYELSDNVRKLICQQHPELYKNNIYINNVPDYDRRKFIGREDRLEDIHNLLQDHQLVYLKGILGIGKTTLANIYVNTPEYYTDYDNIAWVTTEKNLIYDFISQMQGQKTGFRIRNDINVEDNLKSLLDILNNRIKGNTLLIIDNANIPSEVRNFVDKIAALRWKIIITTRATLEYIPLIKINELSEDDAKKLFYKYYTKERNDVVLGKILKHINRHTLVLELLARAGNKHPLLTIDKIFQLLKEDDIKANDLQPQIIIGQHSKHNTESRLFQYLLSVFELENLSNDEEKYLRYFSLLPSIELSFNKLIAIFQIARKNQLKFIDILNGLIEKGWIEKVSNAYKMHYMINTILKFKLEPNEQNCSSIITFFTDVFVMDGLPDFFDYLPYAEYIYQNHNILNVKIKHKLAYRISKTYRYLRDFETAINYAKESLDILKEKENKEKYRLYKARTFRHLSSIYIETYDYTNAIVYADKALEIRQEILGEAHEKTIEAYIYLGKAYTKSGNNKVGKEKLDKAFCNLSNLKVDRDYNLLLAYHNYGNLYLHTQDLSMAIDAFKKAIKHGEEHYKNKSFLLTSTYLNLGISYYYSNKYEEAFKYISIATNFRKEYYPSTHPSLIRSLKWQNKIELMIKNKDI